MIRTESAQDAGRSCTVYIGRKQALIKAMLATPSMFPAKAMQKHDPDRWNGKDPKTRNWSVYREKGGAWRVVYRHAAFLPHDVPQLPTGIPSPEDVIHSLSVPHKIRKVTVLYHAIAVFAGRPEPRSTGAKRMVVAILAPQYGEELATKLATECSLRQLCDMIHSECANAWCLIKDQVAPMFNNDKGWTGKLIDAAMNASLPEYGIRELMDAVAKHGEDSEEAEEIIEDMQERLGIPEVDTPLQAYRRAAMVGIDRTMIVEKEIAALTEKFNRIKATAERMTSRELRGRKQGGQSA